MEEWHQKLHNNTSPDDVVICEALLRYIDGGLDVGAYWRHLNANGITAERLRGYDRPIRSEPSFSAAQARVLSSDLRDYLATLRAVHDGGNLESAAEAVMGYERTGCRGRAVETPAVAGVATPRLRELLRRVTEELGAGPPAGAGGVGWLIGCLRATTAARAELFRPLRSPGALGDRLLDVTLLDLALDAAVRRQTEQRRGRDARGRDRDLLDGLAGSVRHVPR